MVEQFSTLQTDIQSDAIPTCVCEKSIEDKVEKGCLRCGSILGAAMPELGSVGGSLLYALNTWKPAAIIAAKEAALAEATDLATQAGIDTVVAQLKIEGLLASFTVKQRLVDLSSIVTSSTYNNGAILHKSAMELASSYCHFEGTQSTPPFCSTIKYGQTTNFVRYAKAGSAAFKTEFASKSATLTKAKVGAVEATYGGYHISIISSIVAIVVIVLIMVIIYLILRYRRKKKMKKKLQYIKLLEE
ncbi:hypothetical protein PFNF54_05938 [Plasmodium falciparum NF54]|nr:hypothetical protein PFNF54_05938 [Plasmodium falciparum NF54]